MNLNDLGRYYETDESISMLSVIDATTLLSTYVQMIPAIVAHVSATLGIASLSAHSQASMSLPELSDRLAAKIRLRARTQDELDELKRRNPTWVWPCLNSEVMDSASTLLCLGGGTVFCERLRNQSGERLAWRLLGGRRELMSYHHPVLGWFRNGSYIEPLRIMRVHIRMRMLGEVTGADLARLFEVWRGMVDRIGEETPRDR